MFMPCFSKFFHNSDNKAYCKVHKNNCNDQSAEGFYETDYLFNYVHTYNLSNLTIQVKENL